MHVHKIVLKEPIQLGSETITELNFQKAKAKHFKKMKLAELDIEGLLNIASSLTGQTTVCMDNLSPEDMLEVVAYVGKLLPSSPQTGEKPSI